MKIDLTKNAITKGEKVALDDNGVELTACFMGLGWDEENSGKAIDLDANCLTFDANGNLLDKINFQSMKNSNRSIYLTEDNRTGKGDGDDEQIYVDLAAVPANVKSMVFSVTSYEGQTFNEIKNCFARLVDTKTGDQKCIYNFGEKSTNTALVMCKIYRHNDKWKLAAIGTPCRGRVAGDILNECKACL